MDWTPIIVALLALASSLIGNLLLLRKVNAEARLASANADAVQHKSDAEAAGAIVDAAEDMVKMQRDEIARLDLKVGQAKANGKEKDRTANRLQVTHTDDQQQIKDLQFLNAQLRQQITALREQIVSLSDRVAKLE